MSISRPTYAQRLASARRDGGQTQTEGVAAMSRERLDRMSRAGRHSILDHLYEEAASCTTDGDYATVRAQINRVRHSLGLR